MTLGRENDVRLTLLYSAEALPPHHRQRARALWTPAAAIMRGDAER